MGSNSEAVKAALRLIRAATRCRSNPDGFVTCQQYADLSAAHGLTIERVSEIDYGPRPPATTFGFQVCGM